MIVEPTEYNCDTITAYLRDHPNEDYVFWSCYGEIGLAKRRQNYGFQFQYEVIWSFKKNQYYHYHSDFRTIDKESFLDKLKINYPDYFEWFLWNPEWL